MIFKRILSFIILFTTFCFSQNYIVVKEKDNITTNNYPIQIARSFIQGEISEYPQAVLKGVKLPAQATIKKRYSDGSVSHAILHFIIPILKANEVDTISFINQFSSNLTGLSKSEMLGFPSFDPIIRITDSEVKNISAKVMIDSNKYWNWASGSIATSIIVEDHSATRFFDIGSNSYRSIRPIFHITFWNALNKFEVRYIGEIVNTSNLQDQKYSLALLNNNNSLYNKTSFIHPAMTRWTKKFWVGGTPSRISIDHNLKYIAKTKYSYNYDPSKVVSENAIQTMYNNWNSSGKDLYQNSLWTMNQGDPGGRDDIGPYPAWSVRWLYTGDVRMKDVSTNLGDLAAAWPIHFREGEINKNIQGNISGLGKVVSIRNRPSLCLADLTYDYTLANDKVKMVGSVASTSWYPDLAHMPDPVSMQYYLTGEYWYLEELYFWASWGIGRSNGAATNVSWGRGPTGSEGGIPTAQQVRGQAWGMRIVSTAAFLAPDNTPEKLYFSTLMDDMIAGYEGQKGITGTKYYNNPMYKYGQTYWKGAGNAPLFQWDNGSSEFAQTNYGLNTNVKTASSNFEQHFIMLSLGRAKEFGFSTDSLLNRLSKHYISVITDPGFNPYILANGRIPTTNSSSQFFSTWASLKTGYDVSWQNVTKYPLSDPQHGYDFLGMAAVAQTGNEQAWNFVKSKILTASVLNDDPRWAIIPREADKKLPKKINVVHNISIKIK